jgi:hypothetical protein
VSIAELLQKAGTVNPMKRAVGKWFAAEVEMALFAHLMDW